ncbi:MAG: hypothetical protein M1825_005864 [Sarcosagium campestre]|nr:MAG: hypothetical protein M1825_005864 [Sarcosagium campestre]
MSPPTVNGEVQPSAFITHLKTYPVISDSISTFKSNPYGQKSLDIADHGYATFAKPLITYLSGPYQYVSPYVAKADSVADSGLSKVDETFPFVKTPTDKIKGKAYETVSFPFRFATDSKDYVFKTYGSEYKKVGGEGIVTSGKAVITTGLVVTSDTLGWLSSFLGAKKDQAKQTLNEKTNN